MTLHGNYLFEYTSYSTSSDPVPLGFAHLSKCKVIDVDAVSFTLVVYRRPSKRSDLHNIVVKCPNKVRRRSRAAPTTNTTRGAIYLFLLLTPKVTLPTFAVSVLQYKEADPSGVRAENRGPVQDGLL